MECPQLRVSPYTNEHTSLVPLDTKMTRHPIGKIRGMKVTISPCSPGKIAGKLRSASPLLELAQAISDDCRQGVTVEILDDCGNTAAVFGKHSDEDVELF